MLKSSIFDPAQALSRQTTSGLALRFFDSPTKMLEQLECHLTSVNPGLPSHTPHEHRDEELVIVKEGEITVTLNGQESQVGPGSLVFMGSGEHHGIRNAGQTTATYYVVRWRAKQ